MIDWIQNKNGEVILMSPQRLSWSKKTRDLYGKPPYVLDDEEGFNVILDTNAANLTLFWALIVGRPFSAISCNKLITNALPWAITSSPFGAKNRKHRLISAIHGCPLPPSHNTL
jgi:hypothetical protein